MVTLAISDWVYAFRVEPDDRLVLEWITPGLGLTEAQVGRSWKGYAFQVTLHSLLLLNLENQARWAIRTKSIANRAVPNFLDYFYFEGLEAVDPKAVTIIH